MQLLTAVQEQSMDNVPADIRVAMEAVQADLRLRGRTRPAEDALSWTAEDAEAEEDKVTPEQIMARMDDMDESDEEAMISMARRLKKARTSQRT